MTDGRWFFAFLLAVAALLLSQGTIYFQRGTIEDLRRAYDFQRATIETLRSALND